MPLYAYARNPSRDAECPQKSGVYLRALSQSCLFEAESENRISENQWLARLNFPVFGNLRQSHRDSLLTFIGGDLVAVRWKQWRFYFTDVHPTGSGPQRQPGMFSASAPMAGYPKVYNIEMDPHEELQVGALFGWTVGPALEVVEKYLASVKKYPNPPAPNITQFGRGG